MNATAILFIVQFDEMVMGLLVLICIDLDKLKKKVITNDLDTSRCKINYLRLMMLIEVLAFGYIAFFKVANMWRWGEYGL